MNRNREDYLSVQRARDEYGSLYDEILEAFWRNDPMPLDVEDESIFRSEYSLEVRGLLPPLKHVTSVDDLHRTVYDVFQSTFAPASAGPMEAYEQAVQSIWSIVERRRR